MKDLQGITFSQLALGDWAEINYNLGCATPYLVIFISQSYLGKMQTYVRKLNPAVCAKRQWSSAMLKQTPY